MNYLTSVVWPNLPESWEATEVAVCMVGGHHGAGGGSTNR